jgi:hypothetical protein
VKKLSYLHTGMYINHSIPRPLGLKTLNSHLHYSFEVCLYPLE